MPSAPVRTVGTAFGQEIQYSAVVDTGGGDPSGSVAFTDGSTNLCSAPVVAGAASCTSSTTPTGAGQTVTATYSGDDSYAATSASTTVTVAAASQSIAFGTSPPSGAVVNGATYTPSATSTSGLPVALTIDPTAASVCSIDSDGVVSFTASGTCLIDANQPGDGDYQPAPEVTQPIVVAGQAQSVAFTTPSPTSAAVGGTYTPSAVATSGLPAAITVDSSARSVCAMGDGGAVSFLTPGSCVLDADQGGDAQWAPATQAQQSFSVDPGDQSITFDSSPPPGATIGGTYTPLADASSGLAVTFTIDASTTGTCSLSAGVVTFIAAVGVRWTPTRPETAVGIRLLRSVSPSRWPRTRRRSPSPRTGRPVPSSVGRTSRRPTPRPDCRSASP